MKKILVVAAHPDDETLGAGGTILKHKANGDNVSWLIVTNINEKDGYKKSHVELRKKEIDLVAEKYNFVSKDWNGFNAMKNTFLLNYYFTFVNFF